MTKGRSRLKKTRRRATLATARMSLLTRVKTMKSAFRRAAEQRLKELDRDIQQATELKGKILECLRSTDRFILPPSLSGATHRPVSAETRAKISAAQKKRYAELKKKAKS